MVRVSLASVGLGLLGFQQANAAAGILDSTLFISRLVDGPADWGLIEIFNPTGKDVPFYDIELHTKQVGKKGEQEYTMQFSDGLGRPLDPTKKAIGAGSFYRLCFNADAEKFRNLECDAEVGNAVLGLNGNDSIELLVRQDSVDVIGDFGTINRQGVWEVCGNTQGTKKNELIRLPNIVKGNPEPLGSFAQHACEWEVLPFDINRKNDLDEDKSLFISRFLDGDAMFKAIEIANPTRRDVPFADIFLETLLVGKKGEQKHRKSLDELRRINDEQISIPARSLYRICTGSAADLKAANERNFECDAFTTSGLLGLNGNDSLKLIVTRRTDRSAVVVDVIGDPDTIKRQGVWEVCGNKQGTKNQELIRLPKILKGNTEPLGSFGNKYVCEWEVKPFKAGYQCVNLRVNGKPFEGTFFGDDEIHDCSYFEYDLPEGVEYNDMCMDYGHAIVADFNVPHEEQITGELACCACGGGKLVPPRPNPDTYRTACRDLRVDGKPFEGTFGPGEDGDKLGCEWFVDDDSCMDYGSYLTAVSAERITGSDACCACGGGKPVVCQDHPDRNGNAFTGKLMGEGPTVDCATLAKYPEDCINYAVYITSNADFRLPGFRQQTAADACCACGGGFQEE